MPANDPTTVILKGLEWPLRTEGLAAATITPGMLLEHDGAGTYAAHSAAGGANQKIFARRDLSNAGGIDSTIVTGDVIAVGQGRAGIIVNAIVQPTFATTVNVNVISDGSGGVASVTTQGPEVLVGKALESVADPVTGFSRVKVELF